MIRIVIFLTYILFGISLVLSAQDLEPDTIKRMNFSCFQKDSAFIYNPNSALFTFILDGNSIQSSDTSFHFIDSTQSFHYRGILAISLKSDTNRSNKLELSFVNLSQDTLTLENLIPFNPSKRYNYISAEGPWSLARTKLYRKGKNPVGVILPDNAWEMGYAAVKTGTDSSLAAVARRNDGEQMQKGRYKTYLFPEGTIQYSIYFQAFTGEWQNGLKTIFRDNYLFDLDQFNDSLYQREDLQWIRNKYLIALQFAWDKEFYDHQNGGYQFEKFLEKGRRLCGGYDIYGIWPTWPTLGIDERNQWDLYSDLPGGLDKVAELSSMAQQQGTRFFIAYNPWDQSTRQEDPYQGMAKLIDALDANGVVLDTKGSSSIRLQRAADSVKSGVIMYSEGMSVPRDMPGILAGRVHDAIFMPPPLNLNKLIRPDFNIFRVCQLSQGEIHREVALSLFNGYGIELNTFAPGRPDWIESEMSYLGKILMILRENSSNFKSASWTPLIETSQDNIWVNQFPSKGKIIYTIFSLKADGFSGLLFDRTTSSGHYVSLWHHQEVSPINHGGRTMVPATVQRFDQSSLGTRKEGEVDCIAWFPDHLKVKATKDSLYIRSRNGDEIRLWSGNPSYQNTPVSFASVEQNINIIEQLGNVENKIVIQLFNQGELMDERVVYTKPGTVRMISTMNPTEKSSQLPSNMVEIPSTLFYMKLEQAGSFIPYPEYDTGYISIQGFYMDKYPVTNNEFYNFIESTGYSPKDPTNFLKHWENGKYPRDAKNKPVVYISYEDALAYATWAGKRLPSEVEWQYAAQGRDLRQYPWGNTFDSTLCNTGNDQLTVVNEYPGGASPFGVIDMVGNVWQITNDVYDNGSYRFIIIRGGSYYNPTSSDWYVQGGPQALNRSQMLLRVSPGFERNATVGFRCAMDK